MLWTEKEQKRQSFELMMLLICWNAFQMSFLVHQFTWYDSFCYCWEFFYFTIIFWVSIIDFLVFSLIVRISIGIFIRIHLMPLSNWLVLSWMTVSLKLQTTDKVTSSLFSLQLAAVHSGHEWCNFLCSAIQVRASCKWKWGETLIMWKKQPCVYWLVNIIFLTIFN